MFLPCFRVKELAVSGLVPVGLVAVCVLAIEAHLHPPLALNGHLPCDFLHTCKYSQHITQAEIVSLKTKRLIDQKKLILLFFSKIP